MATGWSTVTPENTNFARLCKLLIDGGTKVLKDIFDTIHPPKDLKPHLNDPKNLATLKKLKTKRILFEEQWDKLYPSGGSTISSETFDITLLSLLLRNICNLPTPAKGWKEEPAATSTTKQDDIVRIKLFRNKLVHEHPRAALPDADFTKYWEDITAVLLRLGGNQEDIDHLKKQSMDPEAKQHYIQLLGTVLEDTELYSKRLKHSIIQHTERQQKGVVSSDRLRSAKTDDIFTNLTVHHSKQSHLQPKKARLDEHAPKTLTKIQQCSDIFVDEEEEENLKSILVAGDPGIGKTLFSHKIARDWAKDYISIPNIKFTYLLTFRQLNLLGEEKLLSLRELINLSSLLNSTTMTNEAVIDYIVEHPQQLLIILDGLDEYKDRYEIGSNSQSQFPNDIKVKIPVPALISKLLRKEILTESVTMVTSRPGAASELDKKINFDRYVKISGFSESQVLEYVKKYFCSKPEEERNLALKKVKETEHYMTFGHVPFMCMLMCIVLEWEITNNRTCDNSDNSLTLTEFYSHAINCIEKNFNREVGSLDGADALSAVEKSLDNFSRLAAQLFDQKKFSFTDQDLKKLKLTNTELSQLTSSNLLCYDFLASSSPFQEPTLEYSFNHFTFQEFFVARHFVSTKKQMPAQKMTEMVFQFMSGLMVGGDNGDLMLKVLECIHQQVEGKYRQRLVSMRCLYEFKYGGDVLTRVVSKNPHEIYWDSSRFSSGGCIVLDVITDSDSKALAMFVNKLSSISPTLTNSPHMLYIRNSSLSCCSVESVITSLTNKQSTITVLGLMGCELDDKCIECLCSQLSGTQITRLNLGYNDITDQGVEYMVHHPCAISQLTYLYLWSNRVSDKCKQRTKQFCKVKYPRLELII